MKLKSNYSEVISNKLDIPFLCNDCLSLYIVAIEKKIWYDRNFFDVTLSLIARQYFLLKPINSSNEIITQRLLQTLGPTPRAAPLSNHPRTAGDQSVAYCTPHPHLYKPQSPHLKYNVLTQVITAHSWAHKSKWLHDTNVPIQGLQDG